MRAARLLVVGCTLGILIHGCGDEERPFLDESGEVPEPDDDSGNTTNHPDPNDASLPPVELPDAAQLPVEGGPTDGGHIYVAENCGGVICSGTRRCVQDKNGAYCDCDTGFLQTGTDAGGLDCTLDTQCVFIRPLSHGCRQNLGPDPVVATSFSVEYCGGVPVPPEVVGDLASAFVLTEDNQPIDLTESAAVAVPSTAELIVTLALDVSGSVLANEAVLSPLVSQLRNFVSQLARPIGQPPVTVSVLVFGRAVAHYVEPTIDLQVVDAALAALETDQSRVTSIVQTNGTALYDAVKEGIDQTERLIDLRHGNTQGGILSSGTLVVVTDGNNESGAVTLNKGRISDSPVHVISVGINEDIDDRQLSDIGRDGSFLAPNPDDWENTFDEIASRITDRLQSIYRVAYCSPSTEEGHQLSVGLSNVPTAGVLKCGFDAGNFFESPPPAGAPPPNVFASCQQYITHQCDIIDPNDGIRKCDPSPLACGSECLPGECCNGWGDCMAPASVGEGGLCLEQDALCRPGNMRCADPDEDDEFTCEQPKAVGENCQLVGCEEGLGQCVPHENDAGDESKICQAVALNLGDSCGVEGVPDPSHQCTTLNCAKDPAQNEDIFYCRVEAQVFDVCSGSNARAICESGATCKGNACKARVVAGPCGVDSDCVSGKCDRDTDRCIDSGTCHFSWSEKVAQ